MQRDTTSALLAPTAITTSSRAAASAGIVSVSRAGGGLGESVIAATHRERSSKSAWPTKSEQRCPSGPSPARTKSRPRSSVTSRKVRSYAWAALVRSGASAGMRCTRDVFSTAGMCCAASA